MWPLRFADVVFGDIRGYDIRCGMLTSGLDKALSMLRTRLVSRDLRYRARPYCCGDGMATPHSSAARRGKYGFAQKFAGHDEEVGVATPENFLCLTRGRKRCMSRWKRYPSLPGASSRRASM
jgi:hypothetical protein